MWTVIAISDFMKCVEICGCSTGFIGSTGAEHAVQSRECPHRTDAVIFVQFSYLIIYKCNRNYKTYKSTTSAWISDVAKQYNRVLK